MSTWGEPCEVDNCLGSAVWAGHCITHLTDVESDAFIQQLAETRILVAANIEIEAGVLKKLLSFGGGLEDPPTVVGIVLEGATITGDLSATIRVLRFATFNRATFAGDVDLTFDAHCPVDFAQATFQRRTEIYGTFMHDADFAATSFAQKATIRPTIDGKGVFLNSRLEQGGDFSNARFGTFWLESCVIGGPLVLAGVSTGNRQPMADDQERRFERDSWWAPVPNGSDALVRIFRESQKELLKRHTIAPGVRIVNITFTYPLDLTYQRFAGKQCAFVNVRFDRRVTFAEGALSADHVLLRECYFTEQTAMQVAAEAFDVDSTTFLAGAELDVSAHRLKIERCTLRRAFADQRLDT